MRIAPLFMMALMTWASCESATTSGATLLLRTSDGLAWHGKVEEEPTTISAVVTPSLRNNSVYSGATNKLLTGVVGPFATSVAIGVPGDDGYWVVPALTPDSVDPEATIFSLHLSLAPRLEESPLVQTLPDGKRVLPVHLRGIDENGHWGAATTLAFDLENHDAAGALVLALEWDGPADLDLHVEAPSGAGTKMIWNQAPVADPATGEGSLDVDSNAQCRIDGRNRENIVWKTLPPAGHYIVRVHGASLCGLDKVAFRALAYDERGRSVPMHEAFGVLTPTVERFPAKATAGVIAFEFDRP